MKFTKLFLLLFVGVFLLNCSKDEPSAPKPEEKDESKPSTEKDSAITFFTLNVESSWFLKGLKSWAIIYNDQNELLGLKLIESEGEILFEEPLEKITEKLTITLVSQHNDSGETFNKLSTFHEIPKGSKWNLKVYRRPPDEPRGKIVGEFAVKIDEIPVDNNNFMIQFSDYFGIQPHSAYSSDNNGLAITTNTISLYENSTEQLIFLLDGNNELKYHFITGEKDNTINLSYNEFKTFDKIINIKIPDTDDYRGLVLGYNEEQNINLYGGYLLNNIYSSIFRENDINPLQLGFLDRFDKYWIQAGFTYNNYQYAYQSIGEKPTSIIPPSNPLIEITDQNFPSFKFSTNLDYSRKTIIWEYIEGERQVDYIYSNWSIYSPNSISKSAPDLPDEVIQSLENFDVEKLDYQKSEFFIDFNNYETFVRNKFVNPIDDSSTVHTQEWITFNN